MSSRDCTFRFALILLIVAMTGVISGSAQTVIVVSRPLLDDLNNSGTLLFGSRHQQGELEQDEVDNRLFGRDHGGRGALTMERPRGHSDSFRRLNSPAVSPIGSSEPGFASVSQPHHVSSTYT